MKHCESDNFLKTKLFTAEIAAEIVISRNYGQCQARANAHSPSHNRIWLTENWQVDVSFSCVCLIIDHEFRHSIVKVAVDRRGVSRVDPQSGQIVRSRSLTHRINYKFMCLSAYWQWKLANERARISTVIVKSSVNVQSYVNGTLSKYYLKERNVELLELQVVMWKILTRTLL